MAADNSDGIQGDSTLGVVRSRPVSDVWKFYMKLLYDIFNLENGFISATHVFGLEITFLYSL